MISVIIPLFNKEKTIARCLESVQSQSYGNFECIVVDDGSTDNGASIVKSFKDSRIKYFYKENGGVSSARNFGVAKASADKIVFLDADDYFLEDALKILDDGITLNRTDCAAANFYRGKAFSRFLFSRIKTGVIKDPFKLWYLNCFCPRAGSAIFRKKYCKSTHLRKIYVDMKMLKLCLILYEKTSFFMIKDLLWCIQMI